jgi:hypothetical protein
VKPASTKQEEKAVYFSERQSSRDTLEVMVMSGWTDEYLKMLDDCEKRESRLTDWERGFVDSLRSQIECDRRPSAKQVETLDNVWERATANG